jgi:hypothetical protein
MHVYAPEQVPSPPEGGTPQVTELYQYRDGVCHAHIGKTDKTCGLDARKYTVKRKDVLEKQTQFDGALVVWFCVAHKVAAEHAGWVLTLAA